MKKLFVLFAAVTLFVGVQACKQKEEATTEEATDVTTEVTDSTATATVTDSTATAAPVADSAAAPVKK